MDREWREGELRRKQIAEYAQDQQLQADPTDPTSLRPAPSDDSEPPIRVRHISTADMHRHTLVASAITLALAPLCDIDHSDPEDLSKVPPVSV